MKIAVKAATKTKRTTPKAVPPLKRTLDIVEAMESADLFASWFEGDSWNAWKVILKAAFALPLSDDELVTFRALAGDRAPPTRQVRELWIVAGRRAGKDSIASLVIAQVAAFFSQGDKLRGGERPVALCLATDRSTARLCLNYARSYFTEIPALAGMVQRETRDGFELTNFVDVLIGTNDFRLTRGRAIAVCVMDEVAFFSSETSSSPDVESYRAVVPSMATLPGSMLIGISSPYRKTGLLYSKYKEHFGRDGDVLVVQATSKQLNPTLDDAIIEQALRDDPAGASCEWLGTFRDDAGGYVDIALIEAAVDRGVTVRPPVPSLFDYASFCDPSGGAKDAFTACVSHQEDSVTVVDCLLEIRAPFNPQEAVPQVAALLKSYGLTSTTGDRYAAEWVVSAFAAQGIQYKHSERDRSAIYADALTLFTSGRARILDNQRLVTEFASLERRTSPNGRDKIDHGTGGHDDLANACAGALTLAAQPKKPPTLLFASVGNLAFGGPGSAGNTGGPDILPALPVDHTRPPRPGSVPHDALAEAFRRDRRGFRDW
jgi:hypothetical protein